MPHITLGCTKEIIDLNLEEEFETVVDQLSVELIGENEESNIIIQVKLLDLSGNAIETNRI